MNGKAADPELEDLFEFCADLENGKPEKSETDYFCETNEVEDFFAFVDESSKNLSDFANDEPKSDKFEQACPALAEEGFSINCLDDFSRREEDVEPLPAAKPTQLVKTNAVSFENISVQDRLKIFVRPKKEESKTKNPGGNPYKNQKVVLEDFFVRKGHSSGEKGDSRPGSTSSYTTPPEEGSTFKITNTSDQRPNIRRNPELDDVYFYRCDKAFRNYQFQITQSVLQCNTLVCVPTGFGKTFIALNVIYNFYNWFPNGKIFFFAPSKPLVQQQYDVVCESEGFRKSEVMMMTGSVKGSKRGNEYFGRKIFFMTPQTFQHDINAKNVDISDIVLTIYGWIIR